MIVWVFPAIIEPASCKVYPYTGFHYPPIGILDYKGYAATNCILCVRDYTYRL